MSETVNQTVRSKNAAIPYMYRNSQTTKKRESVRRELMCTNLEQADHRWGSKLTWFLRETAKLQYEVRTTLMTDRNSVVVCCVIFLVLVGSCLPPASPLHIAL